MMRLCYPSSSQAKRQRRFATNFSSTRSSWRNTIHVQVRLQERAYLVQLILRIHIYRWSLRDRGVIHRIQKKCLWGKGKFVYILQWEWLGGACFLQNSKTGAWLFKATCTPLQICHRNIQSDIRGETKRSRWLPAKIKSEKNIWSWWNVTWWPGVYYRFQ